MGNIFAPATPDPPPPQRPVEYRIPEWHPPPVRRPPVNRPPVRRPPVNRPPANRQPDWNQFLDQMELQQEALEQRERERALEEIRMMELAEEALMLRLAATQRQRQPQPQPQPQLQLRPNPQPRGQCRFFASGHCKKGASCRFSHDRNTTPIAGNTANSSNDDNTYELGGAWVKFNNGGTVSKVVFASDYSAINIRNLPHTSSTASVRIMLENVGIPSLGVDIRLVAAQTGQDQCNAVLKAEDPSFARTACAKLATYTTLPNMKVVAVPPVMPHSQSPYQIDCRKVHCAWSRPTREAGLIFVTKGPAFKLQRESRVGSYKVLGSRVTAHVQQSPDGWMVKLTGLSGTVSEQDIIKTIPASERPQKVELGELDYVADPEFDTTIIKSMLLESGPLERWEVPTNSKAKRFNAYGVFYDESSARNAASSLNKKPLSFSRTTQLSVSVVASAKFKILAKIYDMVRPRINAQKPAWDRQYIRFSEFSCKGQYHLLRLEGDNHPGVVKAKECIETIVKGEVVRMEGKDLRCGNFRKDGTEFKKVQTIENTFKVLIIPDIRRSQFRVFGREAVPKETLERITKLLQDCVSESHVIELNDVDFRWASNGGFRFLKSQLGDGIAFFDTTSRFKRILIRGSKADYNNAMAIVATKKIMPRDADSVSGMECPTCFCEPDEPIRMSCDHVYCSDCFVQMCVAEMTADREFQICCPKADAAGKICKKVFSLSEIQEHLPSETFEDILAKSFESYITRHPADFKYCETPDCGQVYRVTSHGSEHPNIFTSVL
ncbi:uncharacterized protein Triagg1_9050 [Trichoderma aggressivum f. europaeum]|uniref:Uncharacterized protein n=1 Tax=Trichoderma aggressivum f. europaeum TaxID=173218 RepID=A0AAE1I7I2_9HYPO|nr:hypothetical protein Triagg1_9050 [Trichoderma aggressivum f. europaeum]